MNFLIKPFEWKVLLCYYQIRNNKFLGLKYCTTLTNVNEKKGYLTFINKKAFRFKSEDFG